MRIALTGNPNSGKTTMYNALTGRNEKIGNWAGVTVDRKESPIKKAYTDSSKELIAVDLPGAYSMSPFTSEESITSGYVKNELEYTYMYDTEKGFAVNQVPAAHSYIQYSNSNPSVIEHKAMRFDSIIWNLITMPSVSTEYYFYLPEG